MKRMNNLLAAGPALIVLGLCLVVAPTAQAADSDMSYTQTIPDPVAKGQPFTVDVGYANAGPDTASSVYVNSYFTAPMGLDTLIDDIINEGTMFDDLEATAEGTDTNGNIAPLFWDDYFCEDLLFQLQGDDGVQEASPIAPVASGDSGSFSFSPTIPMDSPNTGTIEIYEPSSIAQAWAGGNPATIFVLEAAAAKTYGRGGCDKNVGTEDEDTCEYINDNCFGARVSQIEPIDAEFELVNDGTGDPSYACEALIDFTPGNVAVLRRGGCEFGTKGFNAEQAGASAVFMVNSTLCGGPDGGPPNPDSDQCVINMGAGVLGGLVTIPMAMVANADGEPVIAAIEGGATVQGMVGGASTFTTQGYTFITGTEDDDPVPDNDKATTTTNVSAVATAPVAAFTFSPAAPTTGMAVQFTDASTGGAPDTWAWDFGDGGSSTEQNPSYTFTSAGTFDVGLTVTNSGGTSSDVQSVIVTLGQSMTESYFIPAAALAAGAEGSFFQTDVDINNSGATEASYAFLWLPRGENNSSPAQSETYNLAAGASQRFVNVLSEVFSAEPNVAGALAVTSNSGDIKILSRTYDVSQAGTVGTFGQALPGIPAADLIGQNDTRRIIFMSENESLRANLGCVNGVNDNVPIDITTYDEAGNELETQRLILPPWSNNQINQIFADFAPTNGYADVNSIKANAGFFCYGSVLDNNSNDPTSILPVEYGASTPFVNYFIPAAALAAGAEGSFFQTDVDINNAGTDSATYTFMWLPRGANNSDPTISEAFTLAAGASVRYQNVLAEIFEAAPDVAGALAVSADSADLGIMSRTYDVSQAETLGTFGQAIPGIPASNLIGQNDARRIIFMSENEALRANLGCVNGVNDNVPIDITTYDEAGNELETQRLILPPWSNNQINQILADSAPTNGYAIVNSIKANAGFYCYGSVLDNNSNDPTTILPQ